jgi:hypothetical protein
VQQKGAERQAAGMINLWIVVNVVAGALAGFRGIQCHRRERDFWRGYDQKRMPTSIVVGPWMKRQDQ